MSVLMGGFILLGCVGVFFLVCVFFCWVFFLSRKQNLYRKGFWVKTVLLCLLYLDIEITHTSWLGRW